MHHSIRQTFEELRRPDRAPGGLGVRVPGGGGANEGRLIGTRGAGKLGAGQAYFQVFQVLHVKRIKDK